LSVSAAISLENLAGGNITSDTIKLYGIKTS
jgi:hypothetical protein